MKWSITVSQFFHSLGAKGDDEHQVLAGALFHAPAVPVSDQLQGEFVGPLAIVDQDQRSAVFME